MTATFTSMLDIDDVFLQSQSLPVALHAALQRYHMPISGCILIALITVTFFIVNTIALKATGSTSFPQSLWSSCKQYYESFYMDPLDIQDQLLKAALDPQESGSLTYQRLRVTLSGHDRIINSVKIGRSASDPLRRSKCRIILVLHGYGSGLAFFFKVFPDLLEQEDYEIHAPDWLGMGNSSRPDFSIPDGLDRKAARRVAENWFIDSLEEYRVLQNITRFTIIGHSFGAYLAVRYAQKYSTVLDQLILVSPVAVNPSPYSDASTELTEHSLETPIPAVYHDPDAGPTSRVEESDSKIPNPLSRLIISLWERHWTPFDFLRMAGPIGPKLCSSWSLNLPLLEGTFPDSRTTRKLIHHYTYSIFAQKASSERALSYILVAGGHARSPIERVLPTNFPVCLIYGKDDWMSQDAGYRAAEFCNLSGGSCKVYTLNSGGHLSYLEAFSELMEKIKLELNRV